MNPPRSRTIAGTAVARIVASIAISAIESITDPRIGPRSLRSPTEARVGANVVTTGHNPPTTPGIPGRAFGCQPPWPVPESLPTSESMMISRSGGSPMSTAASKSEYANQACLASLIRSR